jgi:hypothetical protein
MSITYRELACSIEDFDRLETRINWLAISFENEYLPFNIKLIPFFINMGVILAGACWVYFYQTRRLLQITEFLFLNLLSNFVRISSFVQSQYYYYFLLQSFQKQFLQTAH